MLIGSQSRFYARLLSCSFMLVSAACSSAAKKVSGIAEPVQIGPNEFVLRKPLSLKCDAAKEFITTMQYLRGESELALASDEATRVAHDVSSGCNGAAKRFIVNVDILRQSGMDARNAVKTGVRLANADDASATAFTKIFQLSFERRHLDLDFAASVRLAQSLSIDFTGDPSIAARDFEEIVEFCKDRTGLDLPKPKCGELASRIALRGADHREPLSAMFIKTFNFLISRDGPGLTSTDAIKIGESMTEAGPKALENFSAVYSYAIAEKGLNLSRSDAVNLAAKIASHSRNQPQKRMTKN